MSEGEVSSLKNGVRGLESDKELVSAKVVGLGARIDTRKDELATQKT